MQIGPQSVHFKVGFIHFDRRTLSLGAILSHRSDHILIGEKIEIFAKNSEKGRVCSGQISMKSESPIKVLGSRTNLSTRWMGEKAKKTLSKGGMLINKITFFGHFWPFLVLSGPFSG